MLQFLLFLTYRWCFPVSSYINQFWIISIFQTLWKICYRNSGFCYVPLKSIDFFFLKSVSWAHMIQRSFSDLGRAWKQNLGIFPSDSFLFRIFSSLSSSFGCLGFRLLVLQARRIQYSTGFIHLLRPQFGACSQAESCKLKKKIKNKGKCTQCYPLCAWINSLPVSACFYSLSSAFN